jgi:integrase
MPAKIKLQANGKYRFCFYLGYNANGKQVLRNKTVTATSMRAAQKMYHHLEATILAGKHTNTTRYKLDAFSKIWLKNYCKPNLSPSTYLSYKGQLEVRILPALGHLWLDKITPLDVIGFTNDLLKNRIRFDGKKKPLSNESISKVFHILTAMLHDAVEWQLLDSNPCDNVPRPKMAHNKISLPPEKDITRMIGCLANVSLKYKALMFLAIVTGLRRGEILGLKWSDINLDDGLLRVERTIQVIQKKLVIKEPKTTGSRRTVSLSKLVVKLLIAHKEKQDERKKVLANKWHDTNWVFTTWDGRNMHPSTPTQWFLDFQKANNLPHMSFHSLRHLSATILIAEGIPLKSVSSRLGHSDIRTTANIYTDALQSVDRTAADKMDAFLKRQKKSNS